MVDNKQFVSNVKVCLVHPTAYNVAFESAMSALVPDDTGCSCNTNLPTRLLKSS